MLIDLGAVDVVHGHSSHHVRPLEIYRGELTMYGAGDFLNDYEGIERNEGYRDDLALMYFPTFDARTGRLTRLRMVPLQIFGSACGGLRRLMPSSSTKCSTDRAATSEQELNWRLASLRLSWTNSPTVGMPSLPERELVGPSRRDAGFVSTGGNRLPTPAQHAHCRACAPAGLPDNARKGHAPRVEGVPSQKRISPQPPCRSGRHLLAGPRTPPAQSKRLPGRLPSLNAPWVFAQITYALSIVF
jgi:hypothetical protein